MSDSGTPYPEQGLSTIPTEYPRTLAHQIERIIHNWRGHRYLLLDKILVDLRLYRPSRTLGRRGLRPISPFLVLLVAHDPFPLHKGIPDIPLDTSGVPPDLQWKVDRRTEVGEGTILSERSRAAKIPEFSHGRGPLW